MASHSFPLTLSLLLIFLCAARTILFAIQRSTTRQHCKLRLAVLIFCILLIEIYNAFSFGRQVLPPTMKPILCSKAFHDFNSSSAFFFCFNASCDEFFYTFQWLQLLLRCSSLHKALCSHSVWFTSSLLPIFAILQAINLRLSLQTCLAATCLPNLTFAWTTTIFGQAMFQATTILCVSVILYFNSPLFNRSTAFPTAAAQEMTLCWRSFIWQQPCYDANDERAYRDSDFFGMFFALKWNGFYWMCLLSLRKHKNTSKYITVQDLELGFVMNVGDWPFLKSITLESYILVSETAVFFDQFVSVTRIKAFAKRVMTTDASGAKPLLFTKTTWCAWVVVNQLKWCMKLAFFQSTCFSAEDEKLLPRQLWRMMPLLLSLLFFTKTTWCTWVVVHQQPNGALDWPYCSWNMYMLDVYSSTLRRKRFLCAMSWPRFRPLLLKLLFTTIVMVYELHRFTHAYVRWHVTYMVMRNVMHM